MQKTITPHMTKLATKLLVVFLTSVPFYAVASEQQLDKALNTIINEKGLTGTPTSDHATSNINSPKAQLGMKLFYSKTLGGDNTTACASCHHPMLGGGENLSLSVGVDSKIPM